MSKKIYVGHAQVFDISGREEKGAKVTLNIEDLSNALLELGPVDELQNFDLLILPRKPENVVEGITHSVKLIVDA